ncbi:hypothetical protein O6H91_Y520700 [Diphasiastrum complanatum]|nr:hypothetical protein O6H91_Y520700 [Diphasiastrum complanatum]
MAEGETEWQREIQMQMQMQMQVGMGVAVGEPIALMARRKPAKDRPNDQKPKPKKRRPHPLAGRSGEGAPIAPPGWLWKAGRRATDMYFCSPTGEKFRAKHLLRAYLDTLPNPPPFGLFRFTIKANGETVFSTPLISLLFNASSLFSCSPRMFRTSVQPHPLVPYARGSVLKNVTEVFKSGACYAAKDSVC